MISVFLLNVKQKILILYKNKVLTLKTYYAIIFSIIFINKKIKDEEVFSHSVKDFFRHWSL